MRRVTGRFGEFVWVRYEGWVQGQVVVECILLKVVKLELSWDRINETYVYSIASRDWACCNIVT